MLLRPVLMPILRNPLQGIADGIRNMLAELLGSSQFFAPLTHSLVLARGTGSPTFTRATTKTVENNDGYLVTLASGEIGFQGARRVQNLVNTTSEDFSNAAWTKVSATVTPGFADPNGGTGAYRLQSTGASGYLEQVIATTKLPIANAAVMAWYIKSNTGASQTVKFARFATVEAKTVTTSWQRLEHFTASAGGSNFYLQDNGGNNLDVLIYRCQIEDVTAQTTQEAGEYVSVGVESAPYYHGSFVDGVKCFATDINGAAIPSTTLLGYLAEGARTNLCLQSQSFDTTWTATALTTISSTRTAPDGTATAFEFDDGVSGGTSHRRFQTPVNTTAVPHTMSVYAKDVDRGWIGFRLTDSGGVNRLCWFNIAAGVVGTAAAGFTTSIQSLPNGWYRCIATLTTFAGDSTPLLFLAPSDGVDVYVGSNKKAQLWGAQVELGSFASTYIPTTTAAVTRAADVLTYTGGDIANLKTLCATFRREVGVVGTGESVALSDGTTTNYIVHAAQPNGTDVRFLSEASSVTQWSVITAYTPGTTTKMATSFATNDIKMAKDGVGQTPDTVATVPAFTQLNVGHVAGILQLNGTTRGVYGWTRNLSQSELNAITA